MASLFEVLALKAAEQAAKRYGNCREDTTVDGEAPYVHPPVLHFSSSFSILPGIEYAKGRDLVACPLSSVKQQHAAHVHRAIESMTVDGLKNRAHRFSTIDAAATDLLERCTGLRELSLLYVQLDSFSGLPRLPLLRSLHMQGNQIDSFKGLLHQPSLTEQLAELKHLELYGCPVAKELGEGSPIVHRLRSRGVRVLLQQSVIPVDMMRQLEQMKECHIKQQQQTLAVSRLPSITVTNCNS
ncbi:putative internalin [Cyclospora cayetanensis]|uniref:Internalin n=1 Tax=Cyclospora cayetanensis TaxID=88456 RepID=A0A1D3D527_9EIME|nr:putative internalin [Cyclospora cayetanensis]